MFGLFESSSSSSSSTTNTTNQQDNRQAVDGTGNMTVARGGTLTLTNGKAFELADKANARMAKFGTDTVKSSVGLATDAISKNMSLAVAKITSGFSEIIKYIVIGAVVFFAFRIIIKK